MFQFLQVLSFISFPVFLMFYGKHYGLTKIKALLLSVFVLVIGYFLMFFLTWAENGFKNFGAQNAIRVYMFIPFVAILAAKVFKMRVRTVLSSCAMSFPMTYAIAHYGCIFEGCCHGFSYKEGTKLYEIAMKLTGTPMLPNQFIEATCALLLLISALIIAKKTGYKQSGKLMGYTMTLFGLGRFFLEFLRDNNKLIILKTTENGIPIGISDLALYAAAMFIIGIIIFIVCSVLEKKENEQSAPVKA